MKPRDILREIYDKKISAHQADELFDEVLEKFHGFELRVEDPLGFLGLSIDERTALYFNHMPYEVIAKWRYEGWPTTCIICGDQISLEKGRWWSHHELEFFGKTYKNVMAHVDCRDEAAEWN